MGIRYLQMFMDKKVMNGTYSVQMDREIRNAKKSTGKPLVVIDLNALFASICSDKRDLLCGNQVRRMERITGMFLKSLVDAGAELVFFNNGKLQPNKYEPWLTRKNDKYDLMINILDAINARMPLNQIVEKFDRTIPPNTCLKLRRIVKQYGKIIISTDMECDQALAIYATKHNALAVITHDTDFLIFE
uniref:Uncharacterized protein n=1 Tax=Anopheles minimus TaxID=112268 RepID=A0A182WFD0_9DIPT